MKHCPHWSIDGVFCCSCGDEVPNKIEQYMPDKCSLSVGEKFEIHSGVIKAEDIKGFRVNGVIQIPKLEKPNITLNLDGDSIDKYTPLTIVLNGEKITLEHEDIKDLFYRQKEQKITKLIDFMRENDFKEKDISGVISNLRSDNDEP